MSKNGIAAITLAMLAGASPRALGAQAGDAAWVRHAPAIHGRIEGSVQVMQAEDLALGGNAVVTGDLLVPGSPAVRVNGHPSYGGTIDGPGAVVPAGHDVVLGGRCSLRHVVRRTDPQRLPTVDPPPGPGGRRCVVLRRRGETAGDFATLRDLTLEGEAGSIAVPAGTYGVFTARGGTGFILGVAGATTPAVYNFQGLALGHGSILDVVGPVVVTVDGSFALERSSTMGAAGHPEWLRLRVSGGGLTVEGESRVHAHLEAPAGTVALNGHSQLVGTVAADRLVVNGNSLLRLAAAAPNQPPAVAVTAPVAGATFYAPASIPLAAAASDADGAIAMVEFYEGTTKIGEDATAPFEVLWTGVPAGRYALTAVATDNAGAMTASEPVDVTVGTPLNRPPTVALISPPDGSAFTSPAAIRLEAAADDPDGTVVKVEFFSGATRVGEALAAPFGCDWLNVAPGGYGLTARATDNAGAASTSAPVSISVATGMPFASDFEKSEGYAPGPLEGQGGWVGNGAALVTDADAQHGEQSVLVPGQVPPAQAAHDFPDSAAGAVTFVDWQALPAAGTDGEGGVCYATDAARVSLVGASETASFWVFEGDGSGGGAWKAAGGLIGIDAEGRASDWHRLTVRADYAAKTWDLYLDGMMVAADVGFLDDSRAAFSGFAASGHPTLPTLLDNFLAGFDNPLFADTDKDGLPDAWELANGLDPTVNDRRADRDGDGLDNLREYRLGTRADRADTDGDGMPDGWEAGYGLNAGVGDAAGDLDGDGVTNLQEYRLGRNPAKGAVPDAGQAVNLRVYLPAF